MAILRGLATAQRHTYRITEGFRNFRRAMRLAQERKDGQAAAELALEQVRTGAVPPNLIVSTLTEGLDAVTDPESELAAMMHARIASPLRPLGRGEEAEEHQRRARELASRHGYKDVELALALIAAVQAGQALDMGLLPDLVLRLEELEKQVGRIELGQAAHNRANWHLVLGDVAQARLTAQRLLEVSRRSRDPYNTNLLLVVLATTHHWLGEFQEVRRVAAQIEGSESGNPATPYYMALGSAAESLGELNEARSHWERAIAAYRRDRLIGNAMPTTLRLASIERRVGNLERADALYNQVLEEMPTTPLIRATQVSIHARLALEAAARSDSAIMAQSRQVLEPYQGLTAVAVGLGFSDSLTVARALGVIAAAEGRWDEAVGYLERAVAFCEEKGLVVELAHCRLALADALMRRNPATGQPVTPVGVGSPDPPGRGDLAPTSEEARHRAVALYDQALADYQRLGMPLYVQDALSRKEILRA